MSDVSRATGAPEVVIGPLTMYVNTEAQVEYPRIDKSPPTGYKLIGKRGAVHYTDDGTNIRMQRTLNKVYGGSTALPLKAFITDADIMLALAVRDARLETLRDAMGFRLANDRMALDKWGDLDLTEFSVLLRGLNQSPVSKGKRLQFWYQRCVFSSQEVSLQYYKTGATEIPLEYTLLEGVPVLGYIEGSEVSGAVATVTGVANKTFTIGTIAPTVAFANGDDTFPKVAAKVQAAVRGAASSPYTEFTCVWEEANKRFVLDGYRGGELPLPTGALATAMGFIDEETNKKGGAKFGVVEQQR